MAQAEPAGNLADATARHRWRIARVAPSGAISMNTSSPAYMLPNNRMPWEMVLAANSITCIKQKFTG